MRRGFGSFFTSRRAGWMAGLAVAAMLSSSLALVAQEATPAATPQTTEPAATPSAQTTDGTPATTATLSNTKPKKKAKEDRVKQGKDTRAAVKRDNKLSPIAGKDAQLPDKQLYDKALTQMKSGHYDVARLDLQTLLNTYPDSQYLMRAKLAVADSWYKEGGSAALAQAEQEYTDFITFFPNATEAAEAQMRVGDIYLKQMDVPDRDYTKALKAEEAYRTMLRQYRDAPPKLLEEVRQKLREVQEVMATREADLGAFYASHENWAASIARYQTVVDTYPQYSHMDDTLIGLGDAYAAQSRIIRTQKLPEAARAKLLQEYDGKAATAYRTVVLEHSAAPHVEDAKERLAAMNLPIPTPTPEQVAASEALEGSRAQYTISRRLEVLFLHKPDTVPAARAGDPPLDDAAITTAPGVIKQLQTSYIAALSPNAGVPEKTPIATTTPAADSDTTPASAPAPPASTAPPTLSDVPGVGEGSRDSATTTMEAAPAAPSGPRGTGLGVEVLTPGVTTSPVSNLPAATGAPDPNNGIRSVGPKDASALPPVEKPAEAPDQVNDMNGQPAQPAAQTKAEGQKKNPKQPYDKNDESSSKHKKKKGLAKLNPL
ncbi:outer membrane protein assembly factor BamD [Granulicella sp. S156]|jgi:outer membrane protein assembly factor BamD|uniref:outer membrane protein assembly factor BamD n=1 Tax=Granulicella sp. S156 TaxID=1747224 RepID=UPI00131AC9BA|nr:outer membrane protein assembly factor BamD [Granulicella sp. S156]